MRWIWIDTIQQLDRGKRCVAVKNVSLAEDILHDHFPAASNIAGKSPQGVGPVSRGASPVFPNTLIIEGMAQTAGILVGHANDYREKVILAKIGRAEFHAAAWPGYKLQFTADIERLDDTGASTKGVVDRIDPVDGSSTLLATIDLMFSHIDRNRAGLSFPEHNFVFGEQFKDLLRQSGFPPPA